MSLNVTFDGFCYLDSGSLSNLNVKYQGLFYPNGTASSPTTWNNVRTVENTGYWNINLGDGDWLTQDGTAINNAKVIIVFWRGNTSDRNELCSGANKLEEWGAFEITLDGSSTYTNQTQVKINIIPILVWDLPLTGYVNTSYTATNNSYDVHTWNWMGTAMYHWRTRYGQNIQLINTVSGTDYDWGDGYKDLGVAGTTNGSHQWTAAGTYEVETVIYDECSDTVTGTKNIDISWHAPTCVVTMVPSDPDPNEPVSFYWSGTDEDNQITSIDWTINDSGAYGNTDTTTSGARDDVIPHSAGTGTDWCGNTMSGGAFTNPGNHVVNVVVHYNDGFSNQTINCNPTFTQNLFSGPTVSFTQLPAQATVTSGVKFTNTSTSTSRVGLGLDDCNEYDWTWTDDGVVTDYLDKPYSYELEQTPTTADCQVKLCANWSDGWDTQQTCIEEDVVFATTVTVTPIDCYYDLGVVGTSSDGSVSGYSWAIASGTTQTGPWSTVWTTPTGMDQQYKTICFADMGWYNITGYVHGTGATTSDYETLYIDEVCPETVISGAICTNIIWNGTGPLDEGGDWDHSKSGTETAGARRTGTNGLDATGLKKNSQIWFSHQQGDDISEYDMLIAWVNMRSWTSSDAMNVRFHSLGSPGGWSDTVSLGDYIDMSMLNVWQRALVPLSRFNLVNYDNVKTLEFESNGNMGMYLDDISLTVGVPIPIGPYDMTGDEFGERDLSATPIEPAVKPDEFPGTPSKKVTDVDLRPSMKGQTGSVPFPKPINL